MTEPTAPPADDTTPPADPDPAAADPPAADTDESAEPPTANSEAARYRTTLRAVEAERDALADRVAGYQRSQVEGIVADMLEVPGDLFDIGRAELGDYFDDEGTLNEHEVRAAASALITQRPGLGKAGRTTPKKWGQTGTPPPASIDWGSVIKG
jgi:hypothetical protein